jgi:hypothetical protein
VGQNPSTVSVYRVLIETRYWSSLMPGGIDQVAVRKPAIRVGGSPFKTFAEAETACEAMLAHLTR